MIFLRHHLVPVHALSTRSSSLGRHHEARDHERHDGHVNVSVTVRTGRKVLLLLHNLCKTALRRNSGFDLSSVGGRRRDGLISFWFKHFTFDYLRTNRLQREKSMYPQVKFVRRSVITHKHSELTDFLEKLLFIGIVYDV